MAAISALNTVVISGFSLPSELIALFKACIPFFLFALCLFLCIRVYGICVGEKANSSGEENKSTISDAVPSYDHDLDPWDRDWLE